MTWHVCFMRCPACNGEVVKVDEVAFRADRKVRIEGTCPRCHRRLFLEESVEDAIPHDETSVEFNLERWEPKGKPS